jgi:hypothetical protein
MDEPHRRPRHPAPGVPASSPVTQPSRHGCRPTNQAASCPAARREHVALPHARRIPSSCYLRGQRVVCWSCNDYAKQSPSTPAPAHRDAAPSRPAQHHACGSNGLLAILRPGPALFRRRHRRPSCARTPQTALRVDALRSSLVVPVLRAVGRTSHPMGSTRSAFQHQGRRTCPRDRGHRRRGRMGQDRGVRLRRGTGRHRERMGPIHVSQAVESSQVRATARHGAGPPSSPQERFRCSQERRWQQGARRLPTATGSSAH